MPRRTGARALLLTLLVVATVGADWVQASRIPNAQDPAGVAAGLHQLFLHDTCTGEYPPQPDTCIHTQLVEKAITIGGTASTVYDVRLRIRGLLEPTTIRDGETPDPAHPYYQVGGTIRARDWSAWHIEVSDPKQTYWLNHYPQVGHVIYKEDFEATIPMAAGATVTVRVIDGNDRQMDNAEAYLKDRMQILEGVTPKPLDGQMLRLDVLRVTARGRATGARPSGALANTIGTADAAPTSAGPSGAVD